MNTEIIVAILSILTLLENLIFLLIARNRDNKKEETIKRNKKSLDLCAQWELFYKTEELYIKEISELRTTLNNEKSSEKTIKEQFRSQACESSHCDKLLKPSEIQELKKLFIN